MKDIKSFLIGFLTCCCLFLIMGQTDGEKLKSYETYLEVEKGNVTIEANENGRFQAFSSNDKEYLLDTTNGKMWMYYMSGANLDMFDSFTWRLIAKEEELIDE